MKQMLVMISLVMSFSLSAFAQTCDVPVCDIPAKLKEIEGMNQTGRAQAIKDLRLKYRGDTEAKNFFNLKEFSDEAKQLLISLKEEDWVIREAVYLQNVARVGLIKYAPIVKDQLIQNFDELSDEGSVFDVLNYWALNVETLEKVSEVLALVTWAEHAKEWAIRAKQEAYIAREAEKIISIGGRHVSRLNPTHEGKYRIAITCDPRPQDCGKAAMDLTHLGIQDTLGARGLAVTLSDDKTGMVYYSYTTSELTKNGVHIRGISTEATPWTRVSETNLDIDPLTGRVSGTLKDVEYPGTLRITGIPMRRVSDFYNDQGPTRVVAVEEIFGRYKGFVASMTNSELVVSRYTSGEIVATISPGGGIQPFGFRAGAYNKTHGVLVLTAAGSGNTGDRKLVLALRKDKKGNEVLTGFILTSGPQMPMAEFARTGDK